MHPTYQQRFPAFSEEKKFLPQESRFSALDLVVMESYNSSERK